MDETLTRACTGCGAIKPITEFGKHSRGLFGVRSKCKTCTSAKNSEWYMANKENRLAKAKEWTIRNKERHKELNYSWWKKNGKYKLQRVSKDRLNNPEKFKSRDEQQYSKRKSVIAINKRKRRGVCQQVTPPWANPTAIASIYEQASRQSKAEGEKYHVDHVVPITPPKVQSLNSGNLIQKSKFVGPLIPVVQGFHCESNLVIKHYRENLSKSNRTWPDMPQPINTP